MRLEYDEPKKRKKHKPNSGRRHKKSKSTFKAILGIVIKAVLFIAAVLYIGIAMYFVGHFAPNTYVNGNEAYGKTPKDFEKLVNEESSKYTLLIYGRNNTKEIVSAADISLKPEVSNEFKDLLKKQNAVFWPIYLFKKTELVSDTVVTYSKENLNSMIENMTFFDPKNIKEPENAHISESAGENGFYIVKETPGNVPVRDAIYKEIEAAIDVFSEELTLSDECYALAEITEEDSELNTLLTNLNQYCIANITYEFGEEILHVDGNKIVEWCDIDGTQVVLNPDKVRAFVNEMAGKYDTFGKKRILKTHSGEEREIKGGDYGWWMNRPEEAAGLIEDIKNGYNGVRTPVYFADAKTYGESDWGDTYVEINLDDQHLWVYEGGVVVQESDFVSGCVNKRTTTPVGTYRITYKERDATLVGENYSSPVSFWMPFNGNVGMHDASWRKEFGKDLYIKSGSHGCINLPVKKAEAIYEIVTKGEPVFVYGGKELPEEEEEPEADEDLEENRLTPEEQIQLLIEAGMLNPDGTIPQGNDEQVTE